MNKKHLSLLAAATIALFSACSDIVENPEPQANLTVLVKNSIDGKPVADATVTLVSSGGAVTTNSEGVAYFGGVTAGTHVLRVEADKFATALYDVSADLAATNASGETNAAVNIMPLSSKLIGYAFYQDENGNWAAATGAKIRAIYTPSTTYSETALATIAANPSVTVTVGADGKYEFTLPPIIISSIEGLENKFGSVTYQRTSITVPTSVLANTTQKLNNIEYSYSNLVNTSTFVLLTRTDLELDDAAKEIELTFSDAIDTVDVESRQDGITVNSPADVLYSADGKTVTIKPLGNWPAAGITVKITAKLKSVEGKAISAQDLKYSFPTEKFKFSGPVENITSTVSSVNYYVISWDGFMDGAKLREDVKYKIFVRDDKGTNVYEDKLGTAYYNNDATNCTVSGTKATCKYTLNHTPAAANSRVEVMVRAYIGNPIYSMSTITDAVPARLD